MTEFAPYLPAGLWVAASSCLVLLLLIVFGYHLYQRSRMKALAADSLTVGQLAARRDALAAEAAQLRQWLQEQKPEALKMEAERHQQELCRVDLAMLQKEIDEKRQQRDRLTRQIAELDMQVVRRRQIHTRLEAEIRMLEEQREELAPMEKYAGELRMELEKGKLRLGQMAQEEVRTQALQTRAQVLRQEIGELTAELEPLRQEQIRLRQFIDQARHAVAVKNEQLLEQKRQLKQIGQGNADMARRTNHLEAAARTAQERYDGLGKALAGLEDDLSAKAREFEDLRTQSQREQAQLEMLIQRREEKACEVYALEARWHSLQEEVQKLVKAPKPSSSKRAPRGAKPTARNRTGARRATRRAEVVFCRQDQP